MKEFVSKYKNFIAIILAVISTIFGVNVSGSSDVAKEQKILIEMISTVITPIVREVLIEENKTYQETISLRFDDIDLRFDELVMQSYLADIDEIALALAEVRTALEVDVLMQYWIDEGWTKKITAIQRISEFKRARDALEERLYSDEVFKTLMTYTN